MKDLNCYVRFWNHPGVEKLRTVDQIKASFLAPVTPRFVQREPFFAGTVVGSGFLYSPSQSRAVPATVFFSIGTEQTRGRQIGADFSRSSLHHAGHRFFLCSAYTTVWPVLNFGVINPWVRRRAGHFYFASIPFIAMRAAKEFFSVKPVHSPLAVRSFFSGFTVFLFSLFSCGCARSLSESPPLGVRANRFTRCGD